MKKTIKKSNKTETENIIENAVDEVSKDFSNASIESSFETSFFYTNDKFINQLDNNELFQFIQTKYPEFNVNNDDSVIKKQLAYLLDNDIFVQYILQYFNLTVFEFFSILYKQFSSIFKGPYLKKLKNIVAGKKYSINERKKRDY